MEEKGIKFFYTRKQMSKLKEKGITLIALVVTIIILLILAGVTLSMTLSENGIFKEASETVEKTAHEMLKENLQIKETDYILEAEQERLTETFIEHLEKTEIISKESEGVYVINVEKLLGRKVNLGNGSNGKDVYKLEKNNDIANVGKIASTEMIKIAAGESTNDKYDIVYYDKSGNGKTIGEISDIAISVAKKTITFTINFSDGLGAKTYSTTEGTTWYEFCQELNSEKLKCESEESHVLIWVYVDRKILWA